MYGLGLRIRLCDDQILLRFTNSCYQCYATCLCVCCRLSASL